MLEAINTERIRLVCFLLQKNPITIVSKDNPIRYTNPVSSKPLG